MQHRRANAGGSPAVRLCGSVALALTACADPVDRHIQTIIDGGDDLGQAKLELNMAKADAVAPLIEAFGDRSLPARARVDLAGALYRLYLREDDPSIFRTLVDALADPVPEVRAGVAAAIGSLRQPEAVAALLSRLGDETDATVQREILSALEFMSLEQNEIRTARFSETEARDFTATLLRLRDSDPPELLRAAVVEWLEVFAEERAQAAWQLYLAADLEGAESQLLAALELVPASMNIGYKLARLYYDSGQRQRGLQVMDERGMVARAVPLPEPPVVDGDLDEDAWADVEPLTDFYQCIFRMSARPTEGRAEAYVGYYGQTLYFLVKGYEPSTAGIVATATERDSQVYTDDCIEIFLDTDHDSRRFFQYIINTLGAYIDDDDGRGGQGRSWNSEIDIGTSVADTFWTVEVAIPAVQLREASFAPGDVWGFNIARVRIGNASEYGQWTPTYGAAERPDRFGYLVFE